MSKSPGHMEMPEHNIRERHERKLVKVMVGDEVIAESRDVIRVDEDKSPVRYYFPRSDVRMETLTPTRKITECPFKGHANYFDLDAGGQHLKDAVWSYETPYDEHADLAKRVAFYDDKYPEISVKVGG